jgi:hypothetical protein
MARHYSNKAAAKVGRAMKKREAGTLKSGRSGRTVKSRKQAIAIGLSEARRSGAKVPTAKSSETSAKKSAKKTAKGAAKNTSRASRTSKAKKTKKTKKRAANG